MKITLKEFSVTVMLRVKLGIKWRRIPATYGRNGRVIPGLVIWLGKELRFDNVAYELRYYVDGEACYIPAGRNASDAEEQRSTLQARLCAAAAAQAAGIAVAEPAPRRTLQSAELERVYR